MFLLSERNEDESRICLYDSKTNKRWTIRTLNERIHLLVTKLTSPKKSLVFCFCTNCAASVGEYLAAIQGKHAVALLDAKSRPEVKAHLTNLYKPNFIFDTAENIGWTNDNQKYLGPEDLGNGRILFRLRDSHNLPLIHKDLALLLTTSGSTGSQKFVRLSKKNVESNAHSIATSLNINIDERAITSLPIYYTYGLSVVNSHLVSNGSVVLTELSPLERSFWNLFREHRCTSLACVPFQYQVLDRIGFSRMNIPSLKTMTQAGGKLTNEYIMKFHEILSSRGARLVVMYGQTEATARIAYLPPDQLPRKLGSVGIAIPDGEIKIDMEGELTTRPSCEGEIVYSGPNVMMGYATSRDDLERGSETRSILYTGDIGYLDEEGFLFVTGRKKRISKLFGLRINLDDIEKLLNKHGPTAVVSDDERIYVFCNYGDKKIHAQYARELGQVLGLPHQVFDFRYIESVPLTPSGKTSYGDLEDLL